MDNDIVSIGDIAELEGKQDECEQNLRRAQEYVLQWQRSLAEVHSAFSVVAQLDLVLACIRVP